MEYGVHPSSDVVPWQMTSSTVDGEGLAVSFADVDSIFFERGNVGRGMDVATNTTRAVPGLQMVGNGVLGLLLAVLCLTTVVGNALVIHAVRTDRKLQTVSNMFIVSLAVADLTVGLVVMPISAVYVLAVRWPFGLAVCQLWLVADYTASTASILNLLVLSADRYCSVAEPLRYGLRRRTVRRVAATIIGVWLASSLWVIPIVGWHVAFGGGRRTVPDDECDTEYAENSTLKVVTALVNYFVPLGVMVVLYSRIFSVVRHRRAELETSWRRTPVNLKPDTDVIELRSVADTMNGKESPRAVDKGDEGRAGLSSRLAATTTQNSRTWHDPSEKVDRHDDSVIPDQRHVLSSSSWIVSATSDEVEPYSEAPTPMTMTLKSVAPDVGKLLPNAVETSHKARRKTIESFHGNSYSIIGKNNTTTIVETCVPPEHAYHRLTEELLPGSMLSSSASFTAYGHRPTQRHAGDADDTGNRMWRVRQDSGELGCTISARRAAVLPLSGDRPTGASAQNSASTVDDGDDDVWNESARNSQRAADCIRLVVFFDAQPPSNVFSTNKSTNQSAAANGPSNLPLNSNEAREIARNNTHLPSGVEREKATPPNKLLRVDLDKPVKDNTQTVTTHCAKPSYSDVTIPSLSSCVQRRQPNRRSLCLSWRLSHKPNWHILRQRNRCDLRHRQHPSPISGFSNGGTTMSSTSASTLSGDVKAARQLGVIVVAFCACFLPYFVCFVVIAFCRECVGFRLMTAVTWIGYVNSTLNPFLYPLCNRQFRDCFRRMFGQLAAKLYVQRMKTTSRTQVTTQQVRRQSL